MKTNTQNFKRKVAICGSAGYVGTAYANFFEYNNRFEVVRHDKGDNNKDEVNQCEMAVVCVPTPQKEDGSCDISIVEEVVSWIECPVILIKSTIAPGTTEYLKNKYNKRICFSPEYVGSSGGYFTPYWLYPDAQDAVKHDFQIVGGDPEDTQYVVERLQRIGGPTKTYAQCSAVDAELCKYAENNWGATKVVWANTWYSICKAFGSDWSRVRELWALDKRVDKNHTCVWPENRGWGGHCYPKDNQAIVEASKKNGYFPEFIQDMINANKKFTDLSKKTDEESEKI